MLNLMLAIVSAVALLVSLFVFDVNPVLWLLAYAMFYFSHQGINKLRAKSYEATVGFWLLSILCLMAGWWLINGDLWLGLVIILLGYPFYLLSTR